MPFESSSLIVGVADIEQLISMSFVFGATPAMPIELCCAAIIPAISVPCLETDVLLPPVEQLYAYGCIAPTRSG